jgi:hypothetical protein
MKKVAPFQTYSGSKDRRAISRGAGPVSNPASDKSQSYKRLDGFRNWASQEVTELGTCISGRFFPTRNKRIEIIFSYGGLEPRLRDDFRQTERKLDTFRVTVTLLHEFCVSHPRHKEHLLTR